VKKLIVWGGASADCGGQFVDVDHCEIGSRRLTEVLSTEADKKWLVEHLPEELKQRGRDVVAARKASAAMSAARAVCDHVRSLHCGTRRDEFLSCGIWTDSKPYGIAPGLYVSVPVSCQGKGKLIVVKGLTLSKTTRDHLTKAEADLIEERDLAQHFFKTKQ